MKKKYLWNAGLAALIGVNLVLTGCKPPEMQGGPPPGFAVPVIVEEVRPQPLPRRIEVVANLLAGQEVDIAARVDGFVEAILFEDGQQVSKGAELFRLDSERYSAAVEQALAREQLARVEFERNKQLRESRAISQQEFDQSSAALREAEAALRIAQENLSDALVRAPFDGFVAERRVDVGQFVNRGQILTSIVDRSSLRAEFRVPERFIGDLATSKEVKFTSPAYPGRQFSGTVFFLSPRVDESTRTLLMRASVENEEELLKPGMFVNLVVVTSVVPDALLVPESALMFRGSTVSLFAVVDGENGPIVQPRQVRTGQRIAGRVEILDGVAPGDRVIAEGLQKVGPGSRVEPMEKKAAADLNKEPGV